MNKEELEKINENIKKIKEILEMEQRKKISFQILNIALILLVFAIIYLKFA